MILDYRRADLAPGDRRLCDWAVKLTLTPGEMNESDIEALRVHGFDDDAITIAAQVVSYFNYINRIADSLGVEDEDWMTPSKSDWLRRKGNGWLSGPMSQPGSQ